MGPVEECSSGTILVGHSGEEATHSTGIKQGIGSLGSPFVKTIKGFFFIFNDT